MPPPSIDAAKLDPEPSLVKADHLFVDPSLAEVLVQELPLSVDLYTPPGLVDAMQLQLDEYEVEQDMALRSIFPANLNVHVDP